ncbi:MAG: polyribonucleotide nucleotidyltransferase [Puniceicoccales bacterium]|jgi:polyribonucleotide nucleotidyltransferase|nr:polyribonucleotide nucleotidyltransferase [Puniceicoccales bacterium]
MQQQHTVTADELGITIATGSIARQANGAVTITKGGTTVFVSAVAAEGLRSPDQDFFPLTVDYREKFAAAGRFPGGYFKREGKPSEKEILTSRLCDRPLRPLFPEGFLNEVQVIGLLLSTDLLNEADILMVNGASAALLCSDIPWNGPIGAVRIGEIDGQFVVNPTNEQMQNTTLDLIYVGNERDMMMIEGSADQIPDSRFIEALEFAHNAIQPIIRAQRELAAKHAKAKREFALVVANPAVFEICKEIATTNDALAKAVYQEKKQDREKAVSAVKDLALAAVTQRLGAGAFDPRHINISFEKLQEKVYREGILNNNRRADGRGLADLRNISAKPDVLPRVHGSAIFQRGETQAVVIATLGTSKDSQELDGLTGGPKEKTFILHYNFPPFSVGECGRFGSPGRREIGHGALAERSLLPVLPSEDVFPYSIRLSSEIMESNGSTSMASVCGGTLALLDAGVPLSAPVAGISCGLVTEEKDGNITKHVILTDIIGAEDHFGDMDFKICGTTAGITGFQLDLKIHGLPIAIAREAIAQNKVARDKILEILTAAAPAPTGTVKETAPRIHRMSIPADKIGALIGPGGKNIKRITEFTGCQIDIDGDDSGNLSVFASNAEALQRAIHEINIVTAQIEVGKTYKGIVRSIKEFGCFVECLPGQEGLVHVSELADFRVNKVEDVCKLGDEIIVKCVGVEERTGKVRLSRRAAIAEKEGREYEPKPRSEGNDRRDRNDGGGRGARHGRGGDRRDSY